MKFQIERELYWYKSTEMGNFNFRESIFLIFI